MRRRCLGGCGRLIASGSRCRACTARQKQPYSDPEYVRNRPRVLLRDGYRCVYCGATNELTVDHVIPASKGGRPTMRNLVTACLPCNSGKRDRPRRRS